MAKRTAIIDIGSNSISLVVYEKSSRYAFHLVEKVRSRVRIGEGAYAHNGLLSPNAMQKAFDTLDDFVSVTKSLGCQKVFAVATSALRDAPNQKEFLSQVQKELKLHIKIIDGQTEAYYGAVAALNLLPSIQEAVTIDIGGGSTELARISEGKIVDTISLNLGTVRLKELFFDQKKPFSEVERYINEAFSVLPEQFNTELIIGIGGTIRALSTAILKDTMYPIESLHAYRYNYKKHRDFITSTATSSVMMLKKTSISRSRYDTIREGSSIFFLLCDRLGAKNIITSKAGVREGVYLSDLLRGNNHLFPANFNVSIKSLVDRFALYEKHIPQMQRTALALYDATSDQFDKEQVFREILSKASKLLLISRRLTIYSNSDMSFAFLLENLNFSLSHKEKVLIAFILKHAHRKETKERDLKIYKKLLPSSEIIDWLSFILALTVCLNKNKRQMSFEASYVPGKLTVKSNEGVFLSKECIKKLKKPASFAIVLESSS